MYHLIYLDVFYVSPGIFRCFCIHYLVYLDVFYAVYLDVFYICYLV